MRTLIVLDHYYPKQSVYRTRAGELLARMHNIGLNLCVVTGPKQGWVPAKADSLQEHTIYRTPYSKISLLKPLLFFYRVLTVARASKVQVIHSEANIWQSLVCYAVAKIIRVPFIYSLNLMPPPVAFDMLKNKPASKTARRLFQFLLERSDKVCVPNVAMSALAEVWAAKEKVVLLPDAYVATGKEYQSEVCVKVLDYKKMWRLEEYNVVGAFASTIEAGHIDTVLLALKQLQNKGAKVKLVIFGELNEPTVKRRIESLGLTLAINWLTRQDDFSVNDFFALVDFVVFAPRSDVNFQSFPVELVRTMAHKIKIIAPRTAPFSHMLSDDMALIYAPEEAEQLAALMTSSAKLLSAKAELSQKWVLKNLAPAVVEGALANAYRQLVTAS